MRITIGGIVGVIFSYLLIGIIQAISHTIYPLDSSVDWNDLKQAAENIGLIGIPAMIMTIFAHFFSIIGGTIVAKVISKGSKIPGYIIGGLVLVGAVINLILLPHPTWFIFTDIISVLIAFWLGMKISKKRIKT